MDKNKIKVNNRQRRRARVRARVFGTLERPRFSVFRSLNHTYVQLIDDVRGKTLMSVSSQEINPSTKLGTGKTRNQEIKKVSKAFGVGELMAKKALEKGIKRVVFDRGGCKYHGRVKAAAEGARKAGLKL